MKTAAIVNPVSGRRDAAKRWRGLLGSLGRDAAKVDTFFTERPGHAEFLAASARRSGYERVIAAGGDGTLFDVLNGLWWEKTGELPSVGMVPLGTGCDYIRNFDVGAGLVERLHTALSEPALRVSLGRCRVKTPQGERQRVFAMILGLGLDAQVVRLFRTGRFGRAGWTAYALSALKAFSTPGSLLLDLEADGASFREESMFLGAALGRFFGKRIVIAPAACPVRDRFELVRVGPAGFWGKLAVLFSAYCGLHSGLRLVQTSSAGKVHVESSPQVWVQADGEVIGKTPVEMEVIPGAVSFACRGIVGQRVNGGMGKTRSIRLLVR